MFDYLENSARFVITGSGRLDLFKKGGDSLMGRYLALPLFPLTVGEFLGHSPTWDSVQRHLNDPLIHQRHPRDVFFYHR